MVVQEQIGIYGVLGYIQILRSSGDCLTTWLLPIK